MEHSEKIERVEFEKRIKESEDANFSWKLGEWADWNKQRPKNRSLINVEGTDERKSYLFVSSSDLIPEENSTRGASGIFYDESENLLHASTLGFPTRKWRTFTELPPSGYDTLTGLDYFDYEAILKAKGGQ